MGVRVIEPTEEMEEAFEDASAPCCGCGDTRAGLVAVLAIVERDRSDANGLMRAAAAARRIADRYDEKGKDRSRADWRMWTAMGAGARMVAVRLTELADAEGRP